jgi:hypothetical protein
MYIINKYVDWACVGGISIILYILITVTQTNLHDYNIGVIALILASFINNPHFIASYGLIYIDERKKLLTSAYHFFSGIVVPIILFLVISYAFLTKNVNAVGLLVNVMYFFVGFHYVRQIYGVSLISLAKARIFLPSWMKWALNISLVPAWLVSYLNGATAYVSNNQLIAPSFTFYSIPYTMPGLDPIFKSINTPLFFIAVAVWVAVVGYIIYRYKQIPVTFIIAFASISLWHYPIFYNSGFFYLIPLFHSLQYLLIVGSVKRNQLLAIGSWKTVAQYAFNVIALAYIFFHVLPENLDQYIPYDKAVFGSTIFVAVFLLFINIHHYFIDAAIWRKKSDIAKLV